MKYLQQFEKYLSEDIKIDITNAASNNDGEELNKLIKKHKLTATDLDFNYNAGFTPLLYAALFGCYKTIQVLVDAGVKLDKQTDANDTALMFAADRCSTDIQNKKQIINDDYLKSLKILLKSNADWNIENKDGKHFIDLIKSDKIKKYIIKTYPEKYENYLIKKSSEKYNL